MNLLVITNNPKRPSFKQRIAVHLPMLREAGIDCEVARLPSGSLVRRKLLKRAGKFRAVFLHKKGLNFFDAFWLGRYVKDLIYDFDDAMMYSPKSPERHSGSHFGRFRRTVKLADRVIAGNGYLAEHARRFNRDVAILPTGLDTNAYRLKATRKDDGKTRLVWIGSRSTLKYLSDIKPALEEVGSRFDNVVLRIICDEFFELKNTPVEKRLWSEQTQVTDLVTSDIGLAPLPDNRFTRGKCGFKVLQYASSGLPIIASPVGVNAEYVRDGVTGFHATDISQWLDRIGKLIKDKALRERMGQAARADVHKFDLQVIGKQLVHLIKDHLQKSQV